MFIFLHHSFLFALLPRKWKHSVVQLIEVKALNIRFFEWVEADRFVELAETIVRVFKGLKRNQLSWVRGEIGCVLFVELINKAVFYLVRSAVEGFGDLLWSGKFVH